MQRLGLLLGVTALVLSACAGGGGTSSASAGVDLATVPAPVDDSGDSAPSIDVESAGVDEAVEEFLSATRDELDAVEAECAAGEGRVQPGADFSNRTFSGPELRCADLTDASFEGAVLEGVDLSGANLTGADFTDATLLISGVGADFTRANFNGADLQTSDLRGAIFASADLSGSMMTTLPGGLTLADMRGVQLGCNVLYGSPGLILTDSTVADDCRTIGSFNRVTFAGSWYGANLSGMDFEAVFVQATDFRRADLSTVNLADYGVFPAGADFSGALLADANLTGVGFYDALFVGSDFTGADMAEVFAATSDFSGATFEHVSMIGFASERSHYVGALFDDVDLTGGSLSYDDFRDALFGEIVAEDLIIDTISCPGAVSTSRYGLCTVGTDVAF